MKTKAKNIRSQMRTEAEDQRRPLSDCKEAANYHHECARKILPTALEHVRLAGQALIEAKAHVRSKAKCRWTLWLKENFEGSRESARGFMRVAEHWNDPVVVAARESNDIPKTYTAILKVIREHRPPKREPINEYKTPDELDQEFNRKEVLKRLREGVNRLTPYELRAVLECGVGPCWDQFRAELKRLRRLQKEGEWPPSDEPDSNDPNHIAAREVAEKRRKRRRRNSQRSREYSY